MREALQASRETLGDKHPETLTSIYNFQTLLEDQGNESEAKLLCRELVDSAIEVLGPDHPDTKMFMDNEWGIQ